MLRKNRIFALLLALALAATAVGCGAPKEEPARTETPAETVQEPSVPDAEDVVFAATGVASDEIVAVLDGNSAPAGLLAYAIGYIGTYLDYTLQVRGMDPLDINETKVDGQDALEIVRSEALNMLKQQLVLENLAQKYGLQLSPEAEMEIAEQRASDIASYGREAYLAEIRRLGLTEESYDRMMRAEYLRAMLYDVYADPNGPIHVPDEELAAFAAELGYITADHILIPTIDLATREPLSDAERAENRALAEDLLWRLRDSRDPIALFKQLADEYSQDTGRLANPDGYTFAEGAMVEEFDAAARALAEGEYSDLVETAYGYHIILRKPLDAAAAAKEVRESYFEQFLFGETDKADMELTPAGERMDVAAVYEALTAPRDDADLG